jgi:hypothetical protein
VRILTSTPPGYFAVLNPLKVIITNYPENKVEEVELINNPEDESMGSRMVPFEREVFIERDDFMEVPPHKYFRLAPGMEVRLKGAYIIKCESFKKNADTGEIEEVYCTYDAETRSGGTQANRKVKGTLHWVAAPHAIDAEVRMYDRLFTHEDPTGDKDHDFREYLNPDSLRIITGKLEPSLATANQATSFSSRGWATFVSTATAVRGRWCSTRRLLLRTVGGSNRGAGRRAQSAEQPATTFLKSKIGNQLSEIVYGFINLNISFSSDISSPLIRSAD